MRSRPAVRPTSRRDGGRFVFCATGLRRPICADAVEAVVAEVGDGLCTLRTAGRDLCWMTAPPCSLADSAAIGLPVPDRPAGHLRADPTGCPGSLTVVNAGVEDAPCSASVQPYLVAGAGPVDDWSRALPGPVARRRPGQAPADADPGRPGDPVRPPHRSVAPRGRERPCLHGARGRSGRAFLRRAARSGRRRGRPGEAGR